MRHSFLLFLTILLSLTSQAQDYLPKSSGEIVEHEYYTLSYNEQHEQANWVYYRLFSNLIKGNASRTDNFRPDQAVSTSSASLSDYKGSGYDRGHLAPAGDMKTPLAMSESFFMSNMSPQDPSFNRGGWKKLEATFRNWGMDESIYVVTGPIFKNNISSIGGNHVTVPGYYYKIAYFALEEKMIAFVMPNEKITNPLPFYVVSTDYVESLTGIDFFPQLEDKLENKLEASTSSSNFTFSQYKSSSNSSKTSSISTQCKGMASSTGERCNNKTTNTSGYCYQHQNEENNPLSSKNTTKTATSSNQCKGIAKSSGVQCKNKTTNENGYCNVHQSQSPDYKAPPKSNYTGKCCATTKVGSQCKRKAAGGSRFCWQHQ